MEKMACRAVKGDDEGETDIDVNGIKVHLEWESNYISCEFVGKDNSEWKGEAGFEFGSGYDDGWPTTY